MRLIDADKLKVLVAVENNGVINTGKLITELFDEMETVEAIPVEWLEKKIAEKKEKFVGMCDELTPVFVMYEQVLKDWRAECAK